MNINFKLVQQICGKLVAEESENLSDEEIQRCLGNTMLVVSAFLNDVILK